MKAKAVVAIILVVIVVLIAAMLICAYFVVDNKLSDELAGYLQVMYENGVTAETADAMLAELVAVVDAAPIGEASSEEMIYFSNDILTILTSHLSEEIVVNILYYGKDKQVTFSEKLTLVKTYAMPKSVSLKDVASSANSLTDIFKQYLTKYEDEIDRVNTLTYDETTLLVGFCYNVNYVFNNGTEAEAEAQVQQLLAIFAIAEGNYSNILSLDLDTIISFIGSLDMTVEDAAEVVDIIVYIVTGFDLSDYGSWFGSSSGILDSVLDFFF